MDLLALGTQISIQREEICGVVVHRVVAEKGSGKSRRVVRFSAFEGTPIRLLLTGEGYEITTEGGSSSREVWRL